MPGNTACVVFNNTGRERASMRPQRNAGEYMGRGQRNELLRWALQ